MRLDETARNSVLFIGALQGDAFRPLGTGFMVSIDVEGVPFRFVVTARHNLEAFKASQKVYLRVNKVEGGTKLVETDFSDWQIHPDKERYIDVAVIPTQFIKTEPSDRFDLSNISEAMFFDDDTIQKIDFAPGSEVATVGLFVSHAGSDRNVAIVRIGNLAAIRDPKELVFTKRGYMDAHLVELRSIGGLSGSPVFAPTPPQWIEGGRIKRPDGTTKRYYLLGVMRGHFNVESDEDAPPTRTADADREDAAPDRINSGIGVVVPIDKVVETIMQPELRLWMDHEAKKMRAAEDARTRMIEEEGAQAPSPIKTRTPPDDA